MEKQPDEPEDFMNEPLSLMSEPTEVQDAVASTSTMPFVQPIIATFKSKAQKQREYRQRIAASRTPAQVAAARKSKNERQRRNRLRQAANLAIASGSLEASTTSSSRSGEKSNNVQTRSQRQHAQQQSTTTAVQPDERVNLTNEPLFSAIPVPVEVQEAVASTSATPFAKPITAAPKTRAQIQREYRQRIAATKTPAQAAAAREARNVRDRNYRLCQAAKLAIARGSLEAKAGQRLNTFHIDTQRQFTDQQHQTLATEPAETTVQPSTSSDQIEVQAPSTWNTKWTSSIMRFKSTFLDNDFDSVGDRLWFRNNLKPITAAQLKGNRKPETVEAVVKIENEDTDTTESEVASDGDIGEHSSDNLCEYSSHEPDSMMKESTNPEESSNAITIQVDVHHRHYSQLSASIVTTSHDCVNEPEATSDLPSIHRDYPKTAAQRMAEYRARKKKETPIVNHRKHKKSDAERAKEYRARKKAKIQSAETSGCFQEKSLYADDKVHQTSCSGTTDAESDSEGHVCNECNKPIKGGRFTCAQCVDYDLCAQCAGERAAHRQHYLLRVPPRRPPDEVERVLQTIRSMLDIDRATVMLPADGSKDKPITEIKTEIKEEFEIYEDPLSYGIKEEIEEEEEDNHATLTHTVPASFDTEYTAKRRKQEICDVTSAPAVILQSSLVGGATSVDSIVPSVVKQEHDSSSQTFMITPSIPPPLIPTMMANTSSHVQKQIFVTHPANLTGFNPPFREPSPGSASIGRKGPVSTPSLVIENMQIRVANKQSEESEDASPSQGSAARWRGLGPM